MRLADGYGATEAFDVMLSDADGETKRLHNTLGVAQDVEHLAQLLTDKFGRTKRELKVCETNEIYCLDGARKRGDDRAPAMQAMLDTAYGTAARKAFQEHFGSDEPKAKRLSGQSLLRRW